MMTRARLAPKQWCGPAPKAICRLPIESDLLGIVETSWVVCLVGEAFGEGSGERSCRGAVLLDRLGRELPGDGPADPLVVFAVLAEHEVRPHVEQHAVGDA